MCTINVYWRHITLCDCMLMNTKKHFISFSCITFMKRSIISTPFFSFFLTSLSFSFLLSHSISVWLQTTDHEWSIQQSTIVGLITGEMEKFMKWNEIEISFNSNAFGFSFYDTMLDIISVLTWTYRLEPNCNCNWLNLFILLNV